MIERSLEHQLPARLLHRNRKCDGIAGPDRLKRTSRRVARDLVQPDAADRYHFRQPLGQERAEIAALTHKAGALLHCDAAQAVGKIDCDVQAIDADYLSISSHKLYGPMGAGALFCAASAPRPEPLTFGGGQQSGLRPGTEPVALIAGFGAAALVAARHLAIDAVSNAKLISRLLAGLTDRQVRYTIIGKDRLRVPGGAAIALDGIDAEMVCTMLARTVQLSTGSACSAGQIVTSHVLDAMGFSYDQAREVVRIKCNRYNSFDEIDMAAQIIAQAVARAKFALDDVASGV